MCAPPTAQAPKRGHTVVYSDALIQGLLGFEQVFHLPLRALQSETIGGDDAYDTKSEQ